MFLVLFTSLSIVFGIYNYIEKRKSIQKIKELSAQLSDEIDVSSELKREYQLLAEESVIDKCTLEDEVKDLKHIINDLKSIIK